MTVTVECCEKCGRVPLNDRDREQCPRCYQPGVRRVWPIDEDHWLITREHAGRKVWS